MNPLDQLHDIHQPPPPGWWPPAPGWWLLALLLCSLLLAAAWWLRRRYQRQAYRRAALAQLTHLAAHNQACDPTALLVLVRRTARAGNPASTWPGLSATELLERLDSAAGGRLDADLQAAGSGIAALAESQYRPATVQLPVEGEILNRWCAWWIRRHREADLC